MRQSTRGWSAALGVGLSLAVLVVVGCQNQGDSDSRTTSVSTGTDSKNGKAAKRTDPDAVRLVSDWPKPQGALIVSGQMIGYLEPCGCSEKQKGGLVRREILEELLRKQGWKLALIDLGSLASEPGQHDRGGPDQAKIKYKTSLEALETLDYDAVALSVDDLRLGTAEVLMQYDNTLAEGPEALKVVAANATPVAGLGFEKRLRPSVRVQAGDVTLGVTAVLDPEAFEALNDPDKAALLTVKSPEEILPAVLADLEKDTKYQVLMVQGPPERAHALAKEFPGFEIVVGTSQFPDPPAQPDVVNDGKTWVLNVGKKGMYVGIVGFFDDAKQPMRYQRIELNDRYDEYADLASKIRPLIGPDLQANLKAAGVLQSYPKRPYALFNAAARRHLRGRRDLQDLPRENLCQVGVHEACSCVRGAGGRPTSAGSEPGTRRRVRELSHHRVRVQRRVHQRRPDAEPQGEPVRELPRTGLEALGRSRITRRTARRWRGPRRSSRRTSTTGACAATTATTTRSSASRSITRRSSTRGWIRTWTRRFTRGSRGDRRPQ